MNPVTFAAWIIIGAALGKLLFGWWNDRKARAERYAAIYEYEDEKTSPERKRLLLARYPHYLIPEPSSTYQNQAWRAIHGERETEEMDR